jgi:hypothetical protein
MPTCTETEALHYRQIRQKLDEAIPGWRDAIGMSRPLPQGVDMLVEQRDRLLDEVVALKLELSMTRDRITKARAALA